MKRKVPRFRRKVQGIPGDCMLPGLGLTSADKTMLVKNVSKIHIICFNVLMLKKNCVSKHLNHILVLRCLSSNVR